jgi:hypothetical protein
MEVAQETEGIAKFKASIHEIKSEVIPLQIQSHTPLMKKHKFVSSPKHDFSIKVVHK